MIRIRNDFHLLGFYFYPISLLTRAMFSKIQIGYSQILYLHEFFEAVYRCINDDVSKSTGPIEDVQSFSHKYYYLL